MYCRHANLKPRTKTATAEKIVQTIDREPCIVRGVIMAPQYWQPRAAAQILFEAKAALCAAGLTTLDAEEIKNLRPDHT